MTYVFAPCSAPVKLVVEGQRDEDLTFLMANDTDPFNRWEAGQRLARKILLQLYDAAQGSAVDADSVAGTCTEAGGVPDSFVDAVKALLTDAKLDGSFKVRAWSSALIVDGFSIIYWGMVIVHAALHRLATDFTIPTHRRWQSPRHR